MAARIDGVIEQAVGPAGPDVGPVGHDRSKSRWICCRLSRYTTLFGGGFSRSLLRSVGVIHPGSGNGAYVDTLPGLPLIERALQATSDNRPACIRRSHRKGACRWRRQGGWDFRAPTEGYTIRILRSFNGLALTPVHRLEGYVVLHRQHLLVFTSHV